MFAQRFKQLLEHPIRGLAGVEWMSPCELAGQVLGDRVQPIELRQEARDQIPRCAPVSGGQGLPIVALLSVHCRSSPRQLRCVKRQTTMFPAKNVSARVVIADALEKFHIRSPWLRRRAGRRHLILLMQRPSSSACHSAIELADAGSSRLLAIRLSPYRMIFGGVHVFLASMNWIISSLRCWASVSPALNCMSSPNPQTTRPTVAKATRAPSAKAVRDCVAAEIPVKGSAPRALAVGKTSASMAATRHVPANGAKRRRARPHRESTNKALSYMAIACMCLPSPFKCPPFHLSCS